MSQVCQVTGKRPMTGNNVSHAQNKTRRRFSPNLHTHRFWVESENRFVKLKVSSKGMRIIDKLGIETVLADLRKDGEPARDAWGRELTLDVLPMDLLEQTDPRQVVADGTRLPEDVQSWTRYVAEEVAR